MTLSSDLLDLLDTLSDKQLEELRHEIDQRTQFQIRTGTMDIDAVLRAAAEITADMTEEEIRQMVDAMNEEYIEPVDDDQWRD